MQNIAQHTKIKGTFSGPSTYLTYKHVIGGEEYLVKVKMNLQDKMSKTQKENWKKKL